MERLPHYINKREKAESPVAYDSLTYKDNESVGPQLEIVNMTRETGGGAVLLELPTWSERAGLGTAPGKGGSGG